MRLVEIGKAKEGSPLAGLADDIERNEAPWREFAGLEAPEAALMPSDLTAKLSLFEQLLVSLPHLPYQPHLAVVVNVLSEHCYGCCCQERGSSRRPLPHPC